MYKEELYENGIVKESKNGLATIIISDSDHCEECSAKLYCKPGNEKSRILIVKDPFGTMFGDRVKIAINGNTIIKATFILYGIPLILLLIGLFLGSQLFSVNVEVYTSLIVLGLIFFYALSIMILSDKQGAIIKSYPKIISIEQRHK